MHYFFLAFFRFSFFFCMRFNCLNITFLTWLQGCGLEEGTDPCVFYTQLTKLLNLIALLGIILFCGNLTLFFDLCSFSFSCDKMLWDWIFLWHMWHARKVSSYKWTPQIGKETHFHPVLIPGSFTECIMFNIESWSHVHAGLCWISSCNSIWCPFSFSFVSLNPEVNQLHGSLFGLKLS